MHTGASACLALVRVAWVCASFTCAASFAADADAPAVRVVASAAASADTAAGPPASAGAVQGAQAWAGVATPRSGTSLLASVLLAGGAGALVAWGLMRLSRSVDAGDGGAGDRGQ